MVDLRDDKRLLHAVTRTKFMNNFRFYSLAAGRHTVCAYTPLGKGLTSAPPGECLVILLLVYTLGTLLLMYFA